MTLPSQNDWTLRNAAVNLGFCCGFKVWHSVKLKDILIVCIMTKHVSENVYMEVFFFKERYLNNGIDILSQYRHNISFLPFSEIGYNGASLR